LIDVGCASWSGWLSVGINSHSNADPAVAGEEGSMKASRSIVSLCQISLTIVGFVAALSLAGCGSDTGVPASTPAPIQASPEAAAKGKAKAKGKVQVSSRQELYRQKAQSSKDSQ
jgi:hypothetical protein